MWRVIVDCNLMEWATLERPQRTIVHARLLLARAIPGRASRETGAAHGRGPGGLAGHIQPRLGARCGSTGPHFADCPSLKESQLPGLTEIINEVEGLRKPVIGWLFSGRKLRALAAKCQRLSTFRKSIEFPADLKMVKGVVAAGHQLAAAMRGKADPRITFEVSTACSAKATIPLPGLQECADSWRPSIGCRELRTHGYLQVRRPPRRQRIFGYRRCAYATPTQRPLHPFSQAPHLEYVARKTEVEKAQYGSDECRGRLTAGLFMQNSATDAKVLASSSGQAEIPRGKIRIGEAGLPRHDREYPRVGEFMPLKKIF